VLKQARDLRCNVVKREQFQIFVHTFLSSLWTQKSGSRFLVSRD